MTGFFGAGGPSPFDQFLAQYFGSAVPGRRAYSVDIMRLMSEQARTLVAEAADHAAEWGSAALDTDHLLLAATNNPGARELLASAGADPARLAKEITEAVTRNEESRPPTTLTSAAKRVLLDAHQVSRNLGATYNGPEHLLLALIANTDSAAGRLLARYGVRPEGLQRPEPGPQQAKAKGKPSKTAALDQFGQDLTASS